MSRPSHWLSLWFLCVGLGMWSLGAFDRAPNQGGFARPTVLQHSGRKALEPVVATLKGQVVDRFGWPVEGAEVTGPEVEGQVREHTLSDAGGHFALEVRGTGQQRLIARADGHGATVAKGMSADPMLLVLGPAVPWTVSLGTESKAEILLAGEGELVDEQGREIAGGRVLVLETGDTVQADEYGRFRLPLPSGPSHLLAYDDKGRVGEMDCQPSRSQGVLPLGQIALHDGLDLVGVLRTSENQLCVEATVQLTLAGMQRQELTDAFGRFAFRGLIPGEYVLTAMPHRGEIGFRETIALSSNHDAEFAMQPSRDLRILVLDGQNSPKPGVHVVAEDAGLHSAYARADEEGLVLLDGLGRGPYGFEVRDPDLSELDVLGFDEQLGQLVVGEGLISPKER